MSDDLLKCLIEESEHLRRFAYLVVDLVIADVRGEIPGDVLHCIDADIKARLQAKPE